jgi:hypothetical protein
VKKLILIAALLWLTAAQSSSYAQDSSSKAFTPAKNSPVRKAVYAVVKKRYPNAPPQADIFKVQGNWARVVFGYNDGDIEGPNLVLKKTGGKWKIVWSFETDDDIDDYVKGVPAGIKNPW